MSNLKTYKEAFAKAEAVCLRAAEGDLEARITDIEEFGELAGCLVAINRLLDLTDAFVRESSASLEYASQRKYFRPFLLRGMLGDFRRGAAVINTARESMKTRHELT
ncbi:MAG TPA: methyl-accepting chemotaxis protein, partial [Kiloniellaceae bacterium]|nr:methyl-accepting chemotaxis protein [Kiloniellaceae bacterium]